MAHLKDLQPDPHNARRHNPRNVGMIEKALGEVGAARSIVVDENNVILAGNATYEAAAAAGIENVQVVDADGETIIAVRRSGLTPEQKVKLALYDNRTAELANWEPQVLAELNQQTDLSSLFYADELDSLLATLGMEAQVKRDLEPGKETDRKLGERRKQIKPVLYAEDIADFERALAATGEINRAAALLEVCRYFLEHHAKGQLHTLLETDAA